MMQPLFNKDSINSRDTCMFGATSFYCLNAVCGQACVCACVSAGKYAYAIFSSSRHENPRSETQTMLVQPHLPYFYLLWAGESRDKKLSIPKHGRCQKSEQHSWRCGISRSMGQVESEMTPEKGVSIFLLQKWPHESP